MDFILIMLEENSFHLFYSQCNSQGLHQSGWNHCHIHFVMFSSPIYAVQNLTLSVKIPHMWHFFYIHTHIYNFWSLIFIERENSPPEGWEPFLCTIELCALLSPKTNTHKSPLRLNPYQIKLTKHIGRMTYNKTD